MKRICNIGLSVALILILAIISFSYVLIKDKDFSENENRYLSQKPVMTIENVLSGKYTKDVEKYIDDQFVLRDKLIEIKTETQRLMGNKDINGVYIAQGDYLIERCLDKDFNYTQLNKNIQSINAFASSFKDKNISVMIAPTAGLILKDKLPRYAPIFNQNEAINTIRDEVKYGNFVDLRNTLLAHKDSYIYYKTDHHWTTLGAFYAYEEWCHQNSSTVNILDYNIKTVTQSFKGSLYSKVLNRNSTSDSIDIFDEEDSKSYSVYYNFGKSNNNSIYDFEKLNRKDKYQVFFGGNHPEIKIETRNKNGKHLLVFKDSYANAFIPFLINDYETICVIDLRYFNNDLKKYISDNNISDILVLYNIMNFSNDKSVEKVSSMP
jgi:hypothetical protein